MRKHCIVTAPLIQKIVGRLQYFDDRFHAQNLDDVAVPKHEVLQVGKHIRDAEIRRKLDRIDRVNDGLQCVVGGRGTHCVGCGRGAELIGDEDRLVPVWWKVRREYRMAVQARRALRPRFKPERNYGRGCLQGWPSEEPRYLWRL